MRWLGGPISGGMNHPARPRAAAESDRVAKLFAAALELPEDARDGFLAAECGGDAVLRGELESLLVAHRGSGSFLAGLDTGRAAELIDSADETMEERRVGPYRLLRELGRGGMGVVHLAERAEGGFEQRVAIKLIKRGMDSEAILRRFLAERQILAGLDHPNIARLLDGGLSEDGQPYFALEYIEGEPLLDYCDARRLPVDARLELFEQACRAVEYAHGRLVVHRDLKPSNLLVTGDGRVKLLDFGVAKLLEAGEAGESTQLTELGARPMTPAYAAPEQLRGEPVTTATDVYALGVVLYELLTGRKPGAAGAASEAEGQEIWRPSEAAMRSFPEGSREGLRGSPEEVASARRTTPQRLRRYLAGDLDTIFLEALRPEPERRYGSAAALLEDLRRHRLGLPVTARPDSVGYRARKFIRRHRVGVAAVSAAVAALVLGLAASLWQAGVAARERDRARQEAKRAAQVKEFLVEVFVAADPAQAKGEELTARELLERGADRIERELADEPAIQAELTRAVGQILGSLGQYPRARALEERSLELLRQAYGPEHPEIALGLATLGNTLTHLEDYAPAEDALRRAVAMGRRLLPGDSPELATCLQPLGVLLDLQGELEEAEAVFREALAIRERTLGPEHPDTVESLRGLARVLHDRGSYTAAAETMRGVLRAQRAATGDLHPEVALTLLHLSAPLLEANDIAGAEAAQREAIEIQRRLFGEDDPILADYLGHFAATLHRKGDLRGEEALQRRALEMMEKLRGEEGQAMAVLLSNQGRCLAQQARFEEAMPLFERAKAMHRRVSGDDHPLLARTLEYQAASLVDQGRPAEALPLLEESLAILRAQYGPEHPRAALVTAQLGRGRAALGEPATAEEHFRQALALQRRLLSEVHPHKVETLMGLGELLARQERLAEAEPLLREAVAQAEQALPPQHWRRAEAVSLLGEVLARLGRRAEAQSLLRDGYEGLLATLGAEHPAVRRAWQRREVPRGATSAAKP